MRLRAVLLAMDIDQVELAKESGIGQPWLSQLLTGDADADQVKQSTLDKITAALIQAMQSGRLWIDLKQG